MNYVGACSIFKVILFQGREVVTVDGTMDGAKFRAIGEENMLEKAG